MRTAFLLTILALASFGISYSLACTVPATQVTILDYWKLTFTWGFSLAAIICTVAATACWVTMAFDDDTKANR